jgi:hypothetical protein
LQIDQLMRERSYPNGVITSPMNVHLRVAAMGPTQVRKRLRECREAKLRHRIVFFEPDEHADPAHAVALLRDCRERPRRRAAESSDELASSNTNAHLALPCEARAREHYQRSIALLQPVVLTPGGAAR